ncbi:hypothetical protein B9G72_17260 [Bordetella bronchiseptica]|nr:hypothetical protein B7P04_17315 [Bordetella bronchiseptica]AWQ11337.1 hypothetical protein B9G72_17260 [Bordetella bronchiseptica]AZW13649.1 hypothetical protein CS344_17100 [Bordetella bronchiseptica]KAK74698.1 hypothetical protein L530_3459 [Bordetella bronchiseptica MO211]CCN17230.1 phage-related hypothetical protein [Bordetella bronchiseptica MO211]
MPDLPYLALLGLAVGAVAVLLLALQRWLNREIEKEEQEE